MTQSLKIECLVTDLALEGEIASFLVTKEQLTAGLSKKADLVDGKIKESNLPDFIANGFQTVNQKLSTLETSITDGIQSAKDYAEAYTDEKLIQKADLVDGKVPASQLPSISEYSGLSEALTSVLDQARRDMIECTDEIQRTKADIGEDGKVLREQLPNYVKIPGLETVVTDLYDSKANVDDVETSFKESQDQLDAHSLLLQSLGSILPYNPSNTYAEGYVTLKDGMLQQLVSGDWVPFKINAINAVDASGESQQQVNYNGGSKWHYRDDGYQENERAVLNNGDIVKSLDDGNTNDPNANMTGWVKTNSASQIFDASGKSQQEINDGLSSIAAMLAIPAPKTGDRVYVKSYHAAVMGALNPYRGGGTFVYDASKSSENNGGSVINGWVRIQDFTKWTPDHFGAKPNDLDFDNYNAFKKCDDFTRSWHIPAGRYKIKQNWQINPKTKITSEGDLSIIEFVDCQFKWNDCNFLEFDNFIIERTGTVVGYAVEAKGSALGFRRIYLNGTKIMKSTGGGIWTSGAWVMTWINPYIHESGGYGFFCDTGGWVTGINNITFIGGELYHNTIGFALERCKHFNIIGTAIEGNYDCGIGIGSQVGELSINGYFEANTNAHIAGRSFNGNTAGLVTNLSILAGSYFLNGSTGNGVAIEGLIPRQVNIQDGVGFYGFASNATNNKHMLTINDPTDSAKCYGSIGLIRTDCPLTHVLSSDCRYLGKQGFKDFYLSKALADVGDTDVSLFVNNPVAYSNILASKAATFDINLECVGAGVASLSFFFYDKDGVQIIPVQNREVTLSTGLNTYQLGLTTTWTNQVKRVMVRRRGDSATDTATGVSLISVSLMQYTNTINKVG